MGWGERGNPKSKWNEKKATLMSNPSETKVASPISNVSSQVNAVSIPVKQDEPMVIQITPRSVFSLFKEFLCRLLRLNRPTSSQPPSHVPMN